MLISTSRRRARSTAEGFRVSESGPRWITVCCRFGGSARNLFAASGITGHAAKKPSRLIGPPASPLGGTFEPAAAPAAPGHKAAMAAMAAAGFMTPPAPLLSLSLLSLLEELEAAPLPRRWLPRWWLPPRRLRRRLERERVWRDIIARACDARCRCIA